MLDSRVRSASRRRLRRRPRLLTGPCEARAACGADQSRCAPWVLLTAGRHWKWLPRESLVLPQTPGLPSGRHGRRETPQHDRVSRLPARRFADFLAAVQRTVDECAQPRRDGCPPFGFTLHRPVAGDGCCTTGGRAAAVSSDRQRGRGQPATGRSGAVLRRNTNSVEHAHEVRADLVEGRVRIGKRVGRSCTERVDRHDAPQRHEPPCRRTRCGICHLISTCETVPDTYKMVRSPSPTTWYAR
jgi:hypothetical protein